MLCVCECVLFPLKQRKKPSLDRLNCDTHIQTQNEHSASKWESHRYYSNIYTDRQLYIILIHQIFYIAIAMHMYHLRRRHLWFDYCPRYAHAHVEHITWWCMLACSWKTQWEFHFQFLDDGISLHCIVNGVATRERESMKNNNHSHFENILLYLWLKLVFLRRMECAIHSTFPVVCLCVLCCVLIKVRSLRNDLLAVGGPNWHRILSPQILMCRCVSSCVCIRFGCACVRYSLFPSFSFWDYLYIKQPNNNWFLPSLDGNVRIM